MSTNQLPILPPENLRPSFPQQPAEAPEPENPLLLVHRALVGRYPLLIVLALVGGAIGGAAGYFAVKPTYRSTGVVHIAPTMPKVMFNSEGSDIIPRFDSYLRTQAELLRNQRTVDEALKSEKWRDVRDRLLPGMTEPQARALFDSSLTIDVPRSSEYINVTFDHEQQPVATAAVQSVMDAFEKSFSTAQRAAESARNTLLEDRRSRLNSQIRAVRERIAAATNDLGPEGFRHMFSARLESLQKLEEQYQQAMSTLASAENAQDKTGGVELNPEAIALFDPMVRDALRRRTALAGELETLRGRLGNSHRSVVDAELRLQIADQQVATAIGDFSTQRPAAPGKGPANPSSAVATVDQLRARLEAQKKAVDDLRSQTADMGKRIVQIESLSEELTQNTKLLEDTKNRVDALTTESLGISGRLNLFPADEPPAPFKDTRKKLAVGAAAAGMGLGLVIVLAMGFLDPRFKNAADLRGLAHGVPMLGILPALPDDVDDPEQASIAAHSVHHIRTLLQLTPGGAENRVLVVTSPAAATGKTSLSLSLGLSFAAAGNRTLLIDADLVGGGLTSRVDGIVRRRIGNILCRGGLISEQQLEQALAVAYEKGKRLGEVMVEMGYLKDDDVTQAVMLQKESRIGLLDALGGEEIDHCVTQLAQQNLFIMPLGNAQPEDSTKLSPKAISKLLERIRQTYDTIIIDTGPIPGSIEAASVAAQADGVILVVSRGEGKPATDRAIEHLLHIGARLAGMVFNRAADKDVQNPAYSFSRPANDPTRNAVVRARTTDDGKVKRYGPMAHAVARYGGTPGRPDSTKDRNA
jgi:polysaccharide biosynthesis transport protein